MSKITNQNGIEELICDDCKKTICVSNEADKDYQDLNWGHECSPCRKARENRYDNYVDPGIIFVK